MNLRFPCYIYQLGTQCNLMFLMIPDTGPMCNLCISPFHWLRKNLRHNWQGMMRLIQLPRSNLLAKV